MLLISTLGHETTSGLLSFLFYYLLKNPSAYRAAQKEVDEVIGRGPITYAHMSKLPYIEACLRETLRLQPTAPAIGIAPHPDTKEWPVLIGGGKYQVEKEQVFVVLLSKVHRDPAVYGDDAEEFKPERMLDENFAKLPPNSWKVSTSLPQFLLSVRF
jgi:cytochrome P450 / NADPH-cytochrome P450 reductase